MSFALYIINDTPRVHSAEAPDAAPVPCPPLGGTGAVGVEALPTEIAVQVSVQDGASPCWLWTGRGINVSSGYGTLQWQGRAQQAHRVVYELLVGPIPHGLYIDHLCMVKRCVAPHHLEPVTPQENVHRSLRARGIAFHPR